MTTKTKKTTTDAMMKILTEKLGRKPTAGEFKVYGRLIDGPKATADAKAGTRASLREMERAGLIEWRDELWHAAVRPSDPADRKENVSLAEIKAAHRALVGGTFPSDVPYDEVARQMIKTYGPWQFWKAVDEHRAANPPAPPESAEEVAYRTGFLAVVATLDDCIRNGLPCVASSVHLAVESKGVDGLRLLASMREAGIVTGTAELKPGPNFEKVAQPVRAILGKTAN